MSVPGRWTRPVAACTALATVVVALSGCAAGGDPVASPTTGTRPGEVAPPLSGTSLEGSHLSLSALHGSVVVVVFWASWCAPCQAEQPAINTLARREVSKGVRFVGVSVDVDPGAAAGYMSRFAVPYDSLVDTSQSIVLAWDVAGPPSTYVVDPRGRIVTELLGPVDTTHLESIIAAAGQG